MQRDTDHAHGIQDQGQLWREGDGEGRRSRALLIAREPTGAGTARPHASSTAVASVRPSASTAAGPWCLGLTSPTAPFTKSAGTRRRRSSSREATPMTSPEYLRLRGPSIVPWIA